MKFTLIFTSEQTLTSQITTQVQETTTTLILDGELRELTVDQFTEGFQAIPQTVLSLSMNVSYWLYNLLQNRPRTPEELDSLFSTMPETITTIEMSLNPGAVLTLPSAITDPSLRSLADILLKTGKQFITPDPVKTLLEDCQTSRRALIKSTLTFFTDPQIEESISGYAAPTPSLWI